jgi:hypothetical protein
MILRACSLSFLLTALVACGDDDGASSGSGGGTSASTTGPSTTSGQSTTGTGATSSTTATGTTGPGGTSASTSTGGGRATCAALCAQAMSLGCPTSPDCQGDCQAGYANAGMCADELDAFLSCVASEATQCQDFQQAPQACEDEADTLIQCSM